MFKNWIKNSDTYRIIEMKCESLENALSASGYHKGCLKNEIDSLKALNNSCYAASKEYKLNAQNEIDELKRRNEELGKSIEKEKRKSSLTNSMAQFENIVLKQVVEMLENRLKEQSPKKRGK